ncbi:MAG: glycosyltransferase, partial [Aeromonas sp.]
MTIFLILWAIFVICHLVFSCMQAWQRGQARRQQPSAHAQPSTPATADVTIIIPAWNDASVLERTLLALHQEVTTFPQRVQVLIVAGGKDNCFERAQALRQRLLPSDADWTVLLQQPRGKNAALNQALAVAKYPYFIFLDADTEVASGWLAAMLQPLVTGEAGATAGYFRGYRRTPVSSIFELDQVVAQCVEEKHILFGGGSIA